MHVAKFSVFWTNSSLVSRKNRLVETVSFHKKMLISKDDVIYCMFTLYKIKYLLTATF